MDANSSWALEWYIPKPVSICPGGTDSYSVSGKCMLTLGTDKHADTELAFKHWGRRLLPEHNYAVIGASLVS